MAGAAVGTAIAGAGGVALGGAVGRRGGDQDRGDRRQPAPAAGIAVVAAIRAVVWWPVSVAFPAARQQCCSPRTIRRGPPPRHGPKETLP